MCVFQAGVWVSAATLRSYLRREGSAWARRPRPLTQTPTCPSEARSPFHLSSEHSFSPFQTHRRRRTLKTVVPASAVSLGCSLRKSNRLIQPTLPYEEPAGGFLPGQRRVEQLLLSSFGPERSRSPVQKQTSKPTSVLPPARLLPSWFSGGRQPLALRLLFTPASPPSLFKAKVALSCSRCCAPEQYE